MKTETTTNATRYQGLGTRGWLEVDGKWYWIESCARTPSSPPEVWVHQHPKKRTASMYFKGNALDEQEDERDIEFLRFLILAD